MTGEEKVADDVQRAGETAGGPVPPTEISPEAGVGGRLKKAREAKGLTVAEVAKMLKLSVRQIESMETDDWERLSCSTIIRGFVRNYARLVDLDPAALMLELDRVRLPESRQLEMPSGTPVRMSEERFFDHRDSLRIVAGLLILLAALGAYYFLPEEVLRSTFEAVKAATQSRPSVSESKQESQEAVISPAAKPADSPAVVQPSPVVLEPSGQTGSTAATVTPPAPTPTALPSLQPPSAAVTAPVSATTAGGGLRFVFSKPSWVEVRDKTGQTIFSQLSPGGTEKTVEGTPPYNVVIGNAAFVSLTYKGQVIDLSKRSKDDVARVILE